MPLSETASAEIRNPAADKESPERPNRRTVLFQLAAATGAAALGTLGSLGGTEAKPRKKKGGASTPEPTPESTPEQEAVQWAQTVLKEFGLESREEQIAFCERWLKNQKDDAYLYLPANIGRFYSGYQRRTTGGIYYVNNQNSYAAVRKTQQYSEWMEILNPNSMIPLIQVPDTQHPIGHESNIEVMQIELARFCLKYETDLREGNFEAIKKSKPTIPGFYPPGAVPAKEALREFSNSEIFEAFGLSHRGSRKLFVEALAEAFRNQKNWTKFGELMTGTENRCNRLGCNPIDDELARFLVRNRDALLEEPIDLNKLMTPLL